ncbi:MAG: cytochrome C oxidase subunit IV family protein [Dehalococcoidia bacterium]
MTLAESRGIKKPKGHDQPDAATDAQDVPAQQAHGAVAPGEQAHPGPLEYVKIALALAFVTAVEVGIYYLDVGQAALVTVLLILSALKFGLVVLWFMHLKFDSRLFSVLFVGGLMLALVLFVVVLATLGSSLV